MLEGRFIFLGKIFSSRCIWAGYFILSTLWKSRSCHPVNKKPRRELKTTGAGRELHICTTHEAKKQR